MQFLALRDDVDAMIPVWAQWVICKRFSILLALIRVVSITIWGGVQNQIGREPVYNFWLFIIGKVIERLGVLPLIL